MSQDAFTSLWGRAKDRREIRKTDRVRRPATLPGTGHAKLSILDAVRQGQWDFEPAPCRPDAFEPTEALPGSQEKLMVLCERVRRGLPLWHPADRRFYKQPSSYS